MKRLFNSIFLLVILCTAYGQQSMYEDKDITSPATFRGGEAALNQYIAQKLVYPTEALENNYTGEVNVVFMVDKNGETKDLYAAKNDVHESLRLEALRVIQSTSGQWIPAKKGTTKVNMIFSVPIKFWIDSSEEVEVAEEKEEMAPKPKWWRLRKKKSEN
jgi:TonB family protein